MKKEIAVGILIILLLMVGGCMKKINLEEEIHDIEKTKDDLEYNKKVTINDKDYDAVLYRNETSEIFINLLPKTFQMSELNGNEKYVYLDNRLPVDSYLPKYITAGDIMLYGNNCLVIFYQSFVSSESYTKIGHINNIDDLGSEDIIAKFEQERE